MSNKSDILKLQTSVKNIAQNIVNKNKRYDKTKFVYKKKYWLLTEKK